MRSHQLNLDETLDGFSGSRKSDEVMKSLKLATILEVSESVLKISILYLLNMSSEHVFGLCEILACSKYFELSSEHVFGLCEILACSKYFELSSEHDFDENVRILS